MPKTKTTTIRRMTKRKSKRPHVDMATIERVIAQAINSESPEDLKVYPDLALTELCRRAGVNVDVDVVCHFRSRLGFAGVPTRLRLLIEQGETK